MWLDLQASSSLPTTLTPTHTAKTATGSSPSTPTTSFPWPSSGDLSIYTHFFTLNCTRVSSVHQIDLKNPHLKSISVRTTRVVLLRTYKMRHFLKPVVYLLPAYDWMSSVLPGCTAAQFVPWNHLFCAADTDLMSQNRAPKTVSKLRNWICSQVCW